MTDDDYTPAELARAIGRIEADVHEIKTDVKAQARIYASKEYVAEVKESLGREIRDLKLELQARRVSWPAVMSAIVATIASAVVLVQIIAR